jgi:hypothetical protein
MVCGWCAKVVLTRLMHANVEIELVCNQHPFEPCTLPAGLSCHKIVPFFQRGEGILVSHAVHKQAEIVPSAHSILHQVGLGGMASCVKKLKLDFQLSVRYSNIHNRKLCTNCLQFSNASARFADNLPSARLDWPFTYHFILLREVTSLAGKLADERGLPRCSPTWKHKPRNAGNSIFL